MQSPQEFFEIAYRTGSDVWTHTPYHKTAMQMLPPLPRDSMVLDVGSGRGLWLFKLVEMGYKVLGMDYVKNVVDWANDEVKNRKISDRARFVRGDVRDIPFTDASFDMVTDIGLLQHLPAEDWHLYAKELRRVIRRDGYILLVALSKDTPRFMGFTPKTSPTRHFEKFGIAYHFFTNKEIADLFVGFGCELLSQRTEFYDSPTDPADSVGIMFSLFQKK